MLNNAVFQRVDYITLLNIIIRFESMYSGNTVYVGFN